MESASLKITNMHIVRVDPGEDVLLAVKEFLGQSGVAQAVITGGYGTLAAHHLHWVKHNRIPTENVFGRGEGGIEILAINGVVVEGEPHMHVALATPEGAYGGHLEEGCIAYVLCELFIAEVEGVKLSRKRIPVSIPGMGKGSILRLFFGETEEE